MERLAKGETTLAIEVVDTPPRAALVLAALGAQHLERPPGLHDHVLRVARAEEREHLATQLAHARVAGRGQLCHRALTDRSQANRHRGRDRRRRSRDRLEHLRDRGLCVRRATGRELEEHGAEEVLVGVLGERRIDEAIISGAA